MQDDDYDMVDVASLFASPRSNDSSSLARSRRSSDSELPRPSSDSGLTRSSLNATSRDEARPTAVRQLFESDAMDP